MTFTWYKIFNKTTFEALDLVSKTYTLDLENLGLKDFLVTKGVSIGITYNDVFLQLELNDENPFAFDGNAIYIDANNDVFWGIEIEVEE